jgi:hypothetical protein
MLTAVRDQKVTRVRLTGYRHDAAVIDLELAPMRLIGVAAIKAPRYIGRRAGLQEFLFLASARFFARRMGEERG